MITAIVILSLLLIVSGYIIWNLLRKVERYQDFSNKLSGWVDNLNQTVNKIVTQIDQVDEKGIFKSDDYVGAIYKDLSTLIKELDNVIIREQNNDDDTDANNTIK